MKAILVIDMPKSCEECGFCKSAIDFGRWFDYCDIINLEVSGKIISSHCPLKPMPERKEFDNQIPYKKSGWNDCIDEIIGGEEE